VFLPIVKPLTLQRSIDYTIEDSNHNVMARSDAFTAGFNDILRRHAADTPNTGVQERNARCDSNPLNPCCDDDGCESYVACASLCSQNDPFGDAGCAAGEYARSTY
jgi:hypothetical protein